MSWLRKYYLLLFASSSCLSVTAQDYPGGVKVSGSLQSDILIPQNDAEIGTEKTEDFQTNTYAEFMLMSRFIDAGVRMEYLEHPLPGFENDFKGWGVPHFWVTGRLGCAEVTAGTFYDQFGLGLIFRTYEERSLGIDNSLLGGRVVVRPMNGLTLKALSGRQRCYWIWNKGIVSGADAEVSLSEWIPSLAQRGTELAVGASWVNKYEKQEEIFADPTHQYNLPEFVNAWELRATLNSGSWSLHAEYANKSQDPSYDNGYSYSHGSAMLLSGSYSKNGLSLLLQAKRSENMSFRSMRSMIGTSSFINYLPAFTQEHTYALAALYPYATQLATGEWAWQAVAGYNFKRNTTLGGKYGMNAKLNFSHVKWEGETYYQDIDIQISRKLSRDFKLSLMYMNQQYNKTVVEGHGGMVRSNLFIAEGQYKLSRKAVLRSEVQYLTTADDQGDWVYALAELSLTPHWMFTVSDMYNVGETHIHYYQGGVTFTTAGHRLQIGYDRTRAGYNCSGGVCRYVPSSRGFTMSYNYSF